MTDETHNSGNDDDADEVEEAVERFLDDADIALSEYDQGYVDADATLSVIRSRLTELRKAVDDD